MEYELLDSVKGCLNRNDSYFKLEGTFKLTKTASAFSQAWIERDFDLENSVKEMLLEKIPIRLLESRYRKFDTNFNLFTLPTHVPANILSSSGAIGSGTNIFMFFPEVLGLQPRNSSDCFGIEFVDVWVNIFEKVILPCCREVLDFHTNLEIRLQLIPKLRETIYLASILHEIGHESGRYKIVPQLDPRLTIKQFYIDVIGEITTDSMAVCNAPEFRSLAIFLVLQRLFWFGRRGFKNNPASGNINQDNDAWLGSLLWSKLQSCGHIKQPIPYKWNIRFDKIEQVFYEITEETNQLFSKLVESENQDHEFHNWMQAQVDHNGKEFVLPGEMADLLSRCVHIDEEPTFKTHLFLHDMNRVGGPL